MNVFYLDRYFREVWGHYFPEIYRPRGYIFTRDLLACGKTS
jgi:hypothetical protein